MNFGPLPPPDPELGPYRTSAKPPEVNVEPSFRERLRRKVRRNRFLAMVRFVGCVTQMGVQLFGSHVIGLDLPFAAMLGVAGHWFGAYVTSSVIEHSIRVHKGDVRYQRQLRRSRVCAFHEHCDCMKPSCVVISLSQKKAITQLRDALRCGQIRVNGSLTIENVQLLDSNGRPFEGKKMRVE